MSGGVPGQRKRGYWPDGKSVIPGLPDLAADIVDAGDGLETLELVLRKAAREHLGLTDGEYWNSEISRAQAAAARARLAVALTRPEVPVAMTLSHDRLILNQANEGTDAQVVVVRCPHMVGLTFDAGDHLANLPCPCNEPSEIVARVVPVAQAIPPCPCRYCRGATAAAEALGDQP